MTAPPTTRHCSTCHASTLHRGDICHRCGAKVERWEPAPGTVPADRTGDPWA